MTNTMPAGTGTAPGAEANAGATAANSGPGATAPGASTGDDGKKECNKPAPTGRPGNTPNSTVSRGMPPTSPTSRCPVCGRVRGAGWPATTGRVYPNYSPDHIVPVAEIQQMKGFACLSKQDQNRVLNNPSNFLPTCVPCNVARQETAWNLFGQAGGHSAFPMTSDLQQVTQTPQFQQMVQGLRDNLQNQINSMPWNKDP